MNLNETEIHAMNTLMKSLEADIQQMELFNKKLIEIAEKKNQLQQFSDEKWMDYYDNSADFNNENLEILNQDSLYNAIVDTDFQARELIKNAVKLI